MNGLLIDDKWERIRTPSDLCDCFRCKHKIGYNWPYACAAFPDGVPEKLRQPRAKHRTPYPGDHGIQFEPIDKAKP